MLFYSNLTLFWSIVLKDRTLTQTMDQNDEFLAKNFFSLKMILTKLKYFFVIFYKVF
jgi:hypothetical protein